MHFMSTPTPSTSSQPSAVSGLAISKGTEILCFAAIIPAFAIIIYTCSRFINGEKKLADHSINSASVVQKVPYSPCSTVDMAMPSYPKSSHQKKESRIQDLCRYLASPSPRPSELSQHIPSRPFANHRCSISIKSPTSPAARLALRPLSLFSAMKKEHTKAKLASRGRSHTAFPDLTHAPGEPSEADKLAMLHLWSLADTIVGAHPHAQPLLTRSATAHGHVLHPPDFRFVSDSGLEIPWYSPANKKGTPIVPTIACAISTRETASTAMHPTKSTQDHQKALKPSASPPSKIPVSKTSFSLSQSSHSSPSVALTSNSTVQSALPCISPAPSSMPKLEAGSCSSKSVQPEHDALMSSELKVPASTVDVTTGPASEPVNTLPGPDSSSHATASSNFTSKIRPKIAWEDRVPGLVTILPLTKGSSENCTRSKVEKEQSGHRRRGELKVVTNLPENNSHSELAYLMNTRRGPHPEPGSGPGTVGKNSIKASGGGKAGGKYREIGGRKFTPDGKENVRPVVGATF
ncbi:hypothetical protein GYMLUDRAFT_834733 [Collybiopsis luxurians FD-317 M1]|uniref:Uncharacterized protein n=1 Tax=Collybiopsis luxurians FD-317 M1 TaxID=944289 RepID=A0A0D0BLL8_9AGAR|nr:hypothetical protein GYMLUDRAFT_834733 [Collybiopsis luxurians FD-317 M1]